MKLKCGLLRSWCGDIVKLVWTVEILMQGYCESVVWTVEMVLGYCETSVD